MVGQNLVHVKSVFFYSDGLKSDVLYLTGKKQDPGDERSARESPVQDGGLLH